MVNEWSHQVLEKKVFWSEWKGILHRGAGFSKTEWFYIWQEGRESTPGEGWRKENPKEMIKIKIWGVGCLSESRWARFVQRVGGQRMKVIIRKKVRIRKSFG